MWQLFLIVIANQKRSFWAINQSDYEKVIYNPCSFIVSRSWSRSLAKKKNIFLDVYIEIKKMSKCCGLNRPHLVSPQHFDLCNYTNFCFDLSHRRSTTVSLETRNPFHTFVYQSTYYANPHSIC